MSRWFAALIFLACPILWGAENVRPEIIFDSTIEVSDSNHYSLGDLVSLKGHSEKFVQTLENYPIESEKLAAGLNAQGIREIYKALVLQHPSIADENPKLILPQKIEIKKVAGFSESAFKRKLINYLLTQCGGCEITIEKVMASNMPTGEWTVKWDDVKLSPSILVPVTFEGETTSGNKSPHYISVTTKTKKNVLVTKRNFQFNENISAEDFETRAIDITFAKEDPITLENLKTFQKTAHPIMKGRAVFPSDLKREPAAERGKAVKVIAGDELYEVSLSGVAEDTGHIGDLIKVRNIESKKVFTAVVVEKGVVKIQ
jgi:flagella basal body P-ring formation protein FlgA